MENNSIRFFQKYHRIHNWRCSLPESMLRRLSEEQSVQWMFWEGSFSYQEITLHGDDHIKELESFVERVHSHSRALLLLESTWSRAARFSKRAGSRARKLLGFL